MCMVCDVSILCLCFQLRLIMSDYVLVPFTLPTGEHTAVKVLGSLVPGGGALRPSGLIQSKLECSLSADMIGSDDGSHGMDPIQI